MWLNNDIGIYGVTSTRKLKWFFLKQSCIQARETGSVTDQATSPTHQLAWCMCILSVCITIHDHRVQSGVTSAGIYCVQGDIATAIKY